MDHGVEYESHGTKIGHRDPKGLLAGGMEAVLLH